MALLLKFKLLFNELRAKEISTQYGAFIPDSAFYQIVTPPDQGNQLVLSMIEHFREAYKETKTGQQEIFKPGAVKIFVALVGAGFPEMIDKFLMAGKLNDSHLPFTTEDLASILPNNTEKSTKCVIHKWLMLLSAPRLRQGQFASYEKSQPLPFLEAMPFTGQQGHNSSLQTVLVPLEHLEFEKNNIQPHHIKAGVWKDHGQIKRVEFVLKIVSDLEIAKREMGTLQWLALHHNILRPICHFEIHDKKMIKSMNFLFERLDGNLAEFLCREEDIWKLGPWEPTELIQAFAELMEGLSVFSKPMQTSSTSVIPDTGAHNDLKPSNILVDEDQKRFVLCDFGSATSKNILERYDMPPPAITNAYQAPESFDRENHSHGPLRDIWAMGCILAEIIIYASSPDSQTLAKFTDRRRQPPWKSWCAFFHHENHLHPKVDAELLKITEPKLKATVPLIREMLNCAPLERPSAAVVADRLKEIASLPDTSESENHHAEPVLPAPTEEVRQNEQADVRPSDTSPVVRSIFQLQIPPATAELLARQEGAVKGLLSKRSSLRETVETKFSGRIKALWKGRGNRISISKWAASPCSNVILGCSDKGDMEDVMTVVAAHIVQDLRQRRPGYRVLHHFCERKKPPCTEATKPESLASSLLGQLSRLSPYSANTELFQLLNQGDRDVRQTMEGLITAIATTSTVHPLIIILDRIISSRDEKAMWQQMKQIVNPLVELIQNSTDKPQNQHLRVKLFISSTLPPEDSDWKNPSIGTVLNEKKKPLESNTGLLGFWGNNNLQWFGE